MAASSSQIVLNLLKYTLKVSVPRVMEVSRRLSARLRLEETQAKACTNALQPLVVVLRSTTMLRTSS